MCNQYIAKYTQNILSVDGTERVRIGSGGGVAIGTTTTSGYTLNVVRSDSTAAIRSYRGTGETVQLMARILQDATNFNGVTFGYLSLTQSFCIYGNRANYLLELGVFNGTVYKTKLVLNNDTVMIDIPTSSSGLGNGGLWNDGGTVKIVV